MEEWVHCPARVPLPNPGRFAVTLGTLIAALAVSGEFNARRRTDSSVR